MNTMNTKQKFQTGDVVFIAKDLGPSMVHFESGQEATVVSSYYDQYGGDPVDDGKDYTLKLADGSHVSWYLEHQLTLVGNSKFCHSPS